MNISLVEKPFRYVVIDNFYTEEELNLILEEVEKLQLFAVDGASTGANEPKKSGLGLFLDTHFLNNRDQSNILRLNRKLFSEHVVKEAVKLDAYYINMGVCTADSTLLNYYKNGQEYPPHRDETLLTAITTLSVGSFEGGDFCFPEYHEVVKFKHNSLIVFPGCVQHAATPVITDTNSYRVSLAQFLNYKHTYATTETTI
jgi:hypothetical protein